MANWEVRRQQIKKELQKLQADIDKLKTKSRHQENVGMAGFLTMVAGGVSALVTVICSETNSAQETAQATQAVTEFLEANGIEQIKQMLAELNEHVNANIEGATTKVGVAVNTVIDRGWTLLEKLALSISGAVTVVGTGLFGVGMMKSRKADEKIENLRLRRNTLYNKDIELEEEENLSCK